MESVTGRSQTSLLLPTSTLSPSNTITLQSMLHKRMNDQMPLQYILGNVDYCGLKFMVRPPVLIPRPETEHMTHWIINRLRAAHIGAHAKRHRQLQQLRIVDLCSGSGNISLTLAKYFPSATVVGGLFSAMLFIAKCHPSISLTMMGSIGCHQ
jgi:HemK-like putative methylase